MTPQIKKTDWDLSPLLKSDDDPSIKERRDRTEKSTKKFVSKWKNNKDYLENPSKLREALDDFESLVHDTFGSNEDGKGNNESYYFWLRTQQNLNDPSIKAKNSQAEEFANKLSHELIFFEQSIGKTPEKEQKKFLESKELQKYHHYLERLFEYSKHQLSEEGEKIMNLKQAVAHDNWTKMVSGFISKEEREVLNKEEKKEKKNFEQLLGLMNNQNKKIRDESAKAFNDILLKNSEIAEAELNSILANKKINDELRKFGQADEARLLGDDVKGEVVEALLDAVSNKFSVAKKYYELKSKLMKVKKLEYHERNVPYGKISKKYSYEDSVNLVYEVFSELDKKFADIFKMFVENNQIDVYPKKGKRGGAFCVYWLITHPVYIMLNHNDEIGDVRTLAHELGHGINNELVKEKQHALYFGTPLSTAEVASTFMEDFVTDKLMQEADDELRLALMMQKLNNDVSTIFRQIALYLFEREMHSAFREKGYLTKEEIGKIFQKHMSSYMGDFVEQSKGSENWWVYWSHIRNFFYVYSYASGLLISKALQNNVKHDKKYIEKVKYFLSAGTSESPEKIFKNAGIDITKKEFWENGLKEVENLLNETEKLAKKLGKI